MSFSHFIKSMGNGEVESELPKTILVSLLSSFGILIILYFISLKNITDFIPKYGFFLFFSILTYAFILPSVRHVRAYKEFQCMSGMMIGMTIGMISGFLPGFFIGGTNGMFVGSLFGMSLGILFGIWNGKCCGIMGTLEGIMAGFMGGLMGAMTSLMMFNDNLKFAGIVVFVVSSAILLGLNYMIYTETRGGERKHKDDEFFVIFWSVLLTIITILVMVFGPRSALFQ